MTSTSKVKAKAHTHVHSHTRVYSQEMAANHFVGCNQTNSGSELVLMSSSLMCKSFSPSAKLIQFSHNPAQVQHRSLLHYLSFKENTVKPVTANENISTRKK